MPCKVQNQIRFLVWKAGLNYCDDLEDLCSRIKNSMSVRVVGPVISLVRFRFSLQLTILSYLDYILKNGSTGDDFDFKILWSLLQDLLIPTWPEGRTTVAGAAIGDAWPLKILASQKKVLPIQPFHKLTQWLAYSLTSAIQRLLSKDWVNMDILTGLPEYRNGGLFVDMQVLALKPEVLEAGLKQSGKTLPEYNADGDVIVEWRAMTVVLLDIVAKMVNEKIARRCGPDVSPLSLAQILEAGTWKAGRELAKQHRASLNACSPILMSSDGTLF
jgi:hypothetical protein